ncbi:hypothetical protein MMC32_008300 [Xylographa parallela]|nr:hypothetical protein [Xylographa parallela]
MADQKIATEPVWYAAYPPPRTGNPVSISRFDVLQLFRDKRKAGKDFVLIDLRRMDQEGGTIHGSINLPAQSLYPTIPTLYTILSSAKIEKVIWYCGSSRGRGTRAAGWFEDYISDQGDTVMKSYTLLEGIKGWALAGNDYVELMDGYEKSFWHT